MASPPPYRTPASPARRPIRFVPGRPVALSSAVTPIPEEDIQASGHCQWGRGLLGVAGTLAVGDGALVFLPRPGRARWLSGKGLRLRLRDIEGISVEGGLAVQVGATVHWFVGDAAERIALLVESELLGMRGQDARFAPGARYLAHSEAQWEAEDGSTGRGHIVLVDDSLLLIGADGQPQALPLARMRSFQVEAATGALVVDDGQREHIIHTDQTARICAWLCLLDDDCVVDEEAAIHEARAGALDTRAMVAVGATRLGIVTGGRGGRCLLLPISELHALDGRAPAQTLRWAGGTLALRFDRPAGAADIQAAVLAAMRRWHDDARGWGGRPEGQLQLPLPGLAQEPPRFCRPVLAVDGSELCTGTLALFEELLVFVPADGSAPETMPVAGLLRGHGGVPSVLAIQGARRGFRMPGGPADVDAFWDLVDAPARLMTGARITDGVLARLAGPAAWVRIGLPDDDAVLFEADEAELRVRGGRVAVELGGRRPGWARPGTALHLEMGCADGITHLHAVLQSAGPATGVAAWRLVLDRPTRLEVFNQRAAYRAAAVGTATLRTEAGEAAQRTSPSASVRASSQPRSLPSG